MFRGLSLAFVGMALGLAPARAVAARGARTRAAIPAALAARWQPLRPLDGAPACKRRELRPVVRAAGRKRWGRACRAAEKLRARLIKEGAAIFYGPDRTRAELSRINAFMKRYVRGPDAILAVAQEVFVAAPALRNLAVYACVRAGRGQVARRFLDQAAVSGADLHLRTAAAIVRVAAGIPKARVAWLVGRDGGGARALLFRAYGAPFRVRDKLIARARATADLGEREDVRAVAAWLSGGRR